MVLSSDWMTVSISYVSPPLLYLSGYLGTRNQEHCHSFSLQYLLSSSKYLSSELHVAGAMGSVRDVTINKTDYVPDLFTFYHSGR